MSDTGKKGHRQRLRDRFIGGEKSSHSEEALLELLLTYAIPQKDVQPLAARLHTDAPLRLFAKAFPDTQELRDVCFYRFLLSEPLEVEIIEDLILSNLGAGRLSRERIRGRLAEKFPETKSIVDCSKAIVDALAAGGIAKVNRTKISFAYREIPMASFAFVLHSEFPEPAMYDIRKLEENRMIRAMLWNPEKLLHMFHEMDEGLPAPGAARQAGDYTLPMNLIAENHLWEIRE
jgi:hypothetical protein